MQQLLANVLRVFLLRGLEPTLKVAQAEGPGAFSAAKALFSAKEQLRQLAAVYLSLCTTEEAGLEQRRKATADLLEERALELQVELSPEDKKDMLRVFGSSHPLMKGAQLTFCSSATSELRLLNDCGVIAASDGSISAAEERWLLDFASKAKLAPAQTDAALALCRRRAAEVAQRTSQSSDNIGSQQP